MLALPQQPLGTGPRVFERNVFAVAVLVATAVLLIMVAIPQWLSKQARWEQLREHVGQIGQLAAGVVDGDLHRQLLNSSNYSAELYATAIEPLVRFHSSNADLFYVYTMVARDNVAHFVLDTAGSANLRTKHQLRASAYMQPFNLSAEYEDGWLGQIANGKTYVTPTYQSDDYGYFLSAHVPIYDSQNRYSGFVGIDFDLAYYLAQEARFRAIEIATIIAALLMALLIGVLFALYYRDLQRRLRELFYRATRDDLTGLLNCRAAKELVDGTLARRAHNCAMLLVAIDHVRLISTMHGPLLSDAIIAYAGNIVRQSAGAEAIVARVAEGEFMVFIRDCNSSQAIKTSRLILAELSDRQRFFWGLTLSVSIGIAMADSGDFSAMYRDADAALYTARVEDRGRIQVFDPCTRLDSTKADFVLR
jgi:diguanylate cyclase (GGDEF)-like protein